MLSSNIGSPADVDNSDISHQTVLLFATIDVAAMDRFAALKAYVCVVEERGFAPAGRLQGLSRSAVSRMIIALEDSLGAQLLNRTTRQVSPTAAGAGFYQRAKIILADLDEAERHAAESRSEATGRFRINAPMSFGTLHLASAVTDFAAAHPRLRVELTLNDRFIDMIEEGFDLAIRIAEPREDSNLVDFRLCELKSVVCASPEYLRAHGRPDHPRQLATHRCLYYGGLTGNHQWRLSDGNKAVSVSVDTVLSSNNGEVLRQAAVQGLGITLLPTFIAGRELQAGRLVSILVDYPPPTLTLTALYPPTRHLSANIRLFTDFLIQRFSSQPYWDLVR